MRGIGSVQLAEISSRHLQIRFRVLLVLDRRAEGRAIRVKMFL